MGIRFRMKTLYLLVILLLNRIHIITSKQTNNSSFYNNNSNCTIGGIEADSCDDLQYLFLKDKEYHFDNTFLDLPLGSSLTFSRHSKVYFSNSVLVRFNCRLGTDHRTSLSLNDLNCHQIKGGKILYNNSPSFQLNLDVGLLLNDTENQWILNDFILPLSTTPLPLLNNSFYVPPLFYVNVTTGNPLFNCVYGNAMYGLNIYISCKKSRVSLPFDINVTHSDIGDERESISKQLVDYLSETIPISTLVERHHTIYTNDYYYTNDKRRSTLGFYLRVYPMFLPNSFDSTKLIKHFLQLKNTKYVYNDHYPTPPPHNP
ncbi:hypothetical protein DLAC_05122 [Tieghemostelium lacteum]|uniref:Uncharacterized protein n=1 Tax=Tieghemostelium lacteum TaxID=361077 RepID=A0A151ZIC0_TIELA|nr:hypothetical protein DLAC_05122 [Tieghemostelium lacteum]|eukprot:KYQ93732.1 hypothetical protein DLAC_05122 [Tieghemostelium lacteum]